MQTMLKDTFIELGSAYSDNTEVINNCWSAIDEHYSSETRHYHSLQHLEHLLTQLIPLKSQISQWNTILFSLFYHDVIYDVLHHDNEERSAAFAKEQMARLGIPQPVLTDCEMQILATKQHQASESNDTNLFTDADLSILGQDWDIYLVYANNVRLEYAIYPDELYIPGRIKVLQHFLAMKQIYKTPYFFHKLEKQAKENLQTELDRLNKINHEN